MLHSVNLHCVTAKGCCTKPISFADEQVPQSSPEQLGCTKALCIGSHSSYVGTAKLGDEFPVSGYQFNLAIPSLSNYLPWEIQP